MLQKVQAFFQEGRQHLCEACGLRVGLEFAEKEDLPIVQAFLQGLAFKLVSRGVDPHEVLAWLSMAMVNEVIRQAFPEEGVPDNMLPVLQKIANDGFDLVVKHVRDELQAVRREMN